MFAGEAEVGDEEGGEFGGGGLVGFALGGGFDLEGVYAEGCGGAAGHDLGEGALVVEVVGLGLGVEVLG